MRLLQYDSDDEILPSTNEKKNNDTQTSSKNKNDSNKPALKEVKAVDLFGNAPIQRTEPLVKKNTKTELGIHSDEELEKTLLEIDNAELESKSDEDKAGGSHIT